MFALLLEVQQRESLNALVEKKYALPVGGAALPVIRPRARIAAPARFGIAVYPDHALDADGLYQQASNALVRAEHSDWPIQV